MSDHVADVVIVGGGLAGSLLAVRLSRERPSASIIVADRRPQLAGDQIWSFHETDLPPASLAWMKPMVVKRWERQDVAFPARRRRMRAAYCTMTSQSVRDALAALPNVRPLVGAEVAELGAESVRLKDGETLRAPLIVDAGGYRPTAHAVNAYQKFFGRVVSVKGGHGVDVPLIMDARVPQIDGFRFVYLLPLDGERIMIEDTRYSDTATLDLDSMTRGVDDYMAAEGWTVSHEHHREQGVLPITLFNDARAFWDDLPQEAVPIGMRAGLFHATTGYSLPLAVETAELIAAQPVWGSAPVRSTVRSFAIRHAGRQTFFRYLNRMMFRGCRPERRWFIMQRFYGLGEGLIERFYGDRLLLRDQLRVLAGKPPIPIWQGVRCMPEVRELRPVVA